MCLKHGNDEQKTTILEQVVGIFRELACNKYSIHLAARVFKLAGDKETLAYSLIPDARKIVTQKEGSKFIEVLYNTKYRSALLKSLFGGHDSATESSHLRDFLDPSGTTLAAVGRLVTKCLGKELQGLSVVQSVVLEYVECLTDKATKLEVLARLQECLLTLMDHRAGVRLAVLALAAADNKARKAVLKAVKGHLSQLCQGEYSFLFVIKLLSVMDDTKRIGNLVSSDICQDLEAITSVTQGVKVLDSLLFAEWRKRLSQSEWEVLDEDLNQVSKKDPNLRRTEVLSTVLPRLSYLVREHLRDFIVDPVRSSLVLGIAENVTTGQWQDAQFIEAVGALVRVVDIAGHSVGQRVLKKIVEAEAEHGASLFAEQMIVALQSAARNKVVKSRGVWILVALAEKSLVSAQAKALFSPSELSALDQSQKGEKALLEALQTK